MDDFHIVSALKHFGSLFSKLNEVLSDCVGAKLNHSKTALNVLQATTIINPRAALPLVYDEFPLLAELPLVTDGFNCVGTPVGHSSFIHRSD
jgi:hypothetical protein